MIVLLNLWTSFDSGLAIEGVFYRFQSALKKDLNLNDSATPYANSSDALFVDVADDRLLLYDSLRDEQVAITDRRLLYKLLNHLQITKNYKYIICDLYFDVATAQDDSLKNVFERMEHISYPSELENKSAVFKQNDIARAGYTSYNYLRWFKLSDDLLKFRLVSRKGEKSLPLLVFEDLAGEQLRSHGAFLRFGKNKYLTNTINIDDHIASKDLIEDQTSQVFKLRHLVNLLNFSDINTAKSITQNKIILIGDFKNDLHPTAFGDMPGILIMYNLIISLLSGDNAISVSWVLFILMSFTTLSYFAFFVKSKKLDWIQGKFNNILGAIAGRITTNGLAIYLISLVSYLLFDKNIEIIALSIWMTVIEYVLKKVRGDDADLYQTKDEY